MGKDLAKAVLKKSLAAGADELILLEDDLFEDLDGYSTAYILAAAIRKIGEYDLIFAGRQAADTNAGLVGSGIAEILGIPSVTVAQKVELGDRKVKVERVVSDGYEVIEVPLPALITISHELGELRSIQMRELMAARKKPVITWKAQDLGVELCPMGRSRMLQLFVPAKEARCEIVEGKTSEEAGANLALKLRESKII
jgi:electron transfer flavoprotein beta subunit